MHFTHHPSKSWDRILAFSYRERFIRDLFYASNTFFDLAKLLVGGFFCSRSCMVLYFIDWIHIRVRATVRGGKAPRSRWRDHIEPQCSHRRCKCRF